MAAPKGNNYGEKEGHGVHFRARFSSKEKYKLVVDTLTTEGRGMALEWIMAEKNFMEQLREQGGLK